MYWDSSKRIWKYNPNMKLIVLLRDPVAEHFHTGQWKQHVKPKRNFRDAIEREHKRLPAADHYKIACTHTQIGDSTAVKYADFGAYSESIMCWYYDRIG